MKNFQNKKMVAVLFVMAAICGTTVFIGCASSAKIAAKSGAQLWTENCQRCHNTPSPSTFSHDQWETIGMHMQTRAMITETEKNKIVAFMKQ